MGRLLLLVRSVRLTTFLRAFKKSDFYLKVKRMEGGGVVLNELQRKVYDKVLRGENIFITGAGGVGKSTVIKEICDALEKRNIKFAVTASTGAAAILVNGITIHRWSGCGVFGASAEVLAKQILDDPKKKIPNVNWTTTKVLIIDEISMIDGSVFDKLEYVARMVRKNPRPFGGMQVVICGDFAQLPPVKPEGGYCFQAKSWEKVITFHNMIELTEVIRQSEVAFRKALCEIRMGKVSSDTVALLRSRIGAKVGTDMIKPTVFLSRREDVLKKNTEELDRIPMAAIPFAARDFFFPYTPSPTDKAKYIEEANKNLQPVQQLQLKVGAQVMLIFNHSDTLVNGSRGVVTAFQAGLPIVQFMSGETMIIEKHKWKVKMTDKLYLEREQIPLILSWAITIHKSQGATVDCAEIDIGGSFEHGQAYVALSRVRSLDGLSLRGGDLSRITVHPLVKKFYENLSPPPQPVATAVPPPPSLRPAVQLKPIEKKRLPTEDLKDLREDETKKQNKTE